MPHKMAVGDCTLSVPEQKSQQGPRNLSIAWHIMRRHRFPYLSLATRLAIHRFSRFIAHATRRQPLNADLWTRHRNGMNARRCRDNSRFVGDRHAQGDEWHSSGTVVRDWRLRAGGYKAGLSPDDAALSSISCPSATSSIERMEW